MLTAPSPSRTIGRAIEPALNSSKLGDALCAAAYVIAIGVAIAGNDIPKQLKTVTMASALGASLVQWRTHADADAVNAQIAADALRETHLRGINSELVQEQALVASQREIERDRALLEQISRAPLLLQPRLLEANGFGDIVPLLQGGNGAQPQAIAAAPATPAPALKDAEWTEDTAPATRYDWIKTCLSAPAVLVFGPQGAGKSTFAEYLVQQRHNAGHEIEVLDPHRKYGSWPGLACYGQGMNYTELDNRLIDFESTTRDRYEQFGSIPNFNPRPKTVVAEEFTNWADRCESAGDFFSASLSDNRKVKMHSLYVSHARELGALGGKKGASKMRDRGLLEVELLADIGPDGTPKPAMRGKLRYPNTKEWIDVEVPDLSGFNFEIDRPGQDFAEAALDELTPAEKLDDTADLINLRLWYWQQNPAPTHELLLERWNSVAEAPLALENMPHLEAALRLSDADFNEWVEGALSD